MNKDIKSKTLALALISLFFVSSFAFAKEHAGSTVPSGFSKGEKKGWSGDTTPPGWTKGEKKGWNGGTVPRGLSKKKMRTAGEKAKGGADNAKKTLMNKEA